MPKHKVKKDFQGIPHCELESLARALFPSIQAFFDSEEGRKEFEEWQTQQDVSTKIA